MGGDPDAASILFMAAADAIPRWSMRKPNRRPPLAYVSGVCWCAPPRVGQIDQAMRKWAAFSAHELVRPMPGAAWVAIALNDASEGWTTPAWKELIPTEW